jgi:hypothetical protein
MPTSSSNVCSQQYTGKHLLRLSSSQFDPEETSVDGNFKESRRVPSIRLGHWFRRRSVKCLQSINAEHMLRNTKSWEMIKEIQLAGLPCLGTLHIAGQH